MVVWIYNYQKFKNSKELEKFEISLFQSYIPRIAAKQYYNDHFGISVSAKKFVPIAISCVDAEKKMTTKFVEVKMKQIPLGIRKQLSLRTIMFEEFYSQLASREIFSKDIVSHGFSLEKIYSMTISTLSAHHSSSFSEKIKETINHVCGILDLPPVNSPYLGLCASQRDLCVYVNENIITGFGNNNILRLSDKYEIIGIERNVNRKYDFCVKHFEHTFACCITYDYEKNLHVYCIIGVNGNIVYSTYDVETMRLYCSDKVILHNCEFSLPGMHVNTLLGNHASVVDTLEKMTCFLRVYKTISELSERKTTTNSTWSLFPKNFYYGEVLPQKTFSKPNDIVMNVHKEGYFSIYTTKSLYLQAIVESSMKDFNVVLLKKIDDYLRSLLKGTFFEVELVKIIYMLLDNHLSALCSQYNIDMTARINELMEDIKKYYGSRVFRIDSSKVILYDSVLSADVSSSISDSETVIYDSLDENVIETPKCIIGHTPKIAENFTEYSLI